MRSQREQTLENPIMLSNLVYSVGCYDLHNRMLAAYSVSTSLGAEAVSALREELRLRRGSGVEPQVVGLTPKTTSIDRRANTMKPYILRAHKAVEPQTLHHNNLGRASDKSARRSHRA